jgi:hypothetical protein
MLADVVRQYLQMRYALPALERTTSEILAAIEESSELGSRERVLVQELLNSCDVVKFAGALNGPDECRQLMRLARDFASEPVRRPSTEVHGVERT